MPSFLAPIIAFYDYALQPIPALAWLGAPVSTLDVAGALRLAMSLRQVRELYYDQHVSRISATSSIPEDGKRVGELPEPRSRVRDLVATLVLVHGGEAISGASQVPPSSAGAYSSCSVCSTVAWLAAFVPRLRHFARDILERGCAGRLVAHSPESLHTH